jgi:hypothetical protein
VAGLSNPPPNLAAFQETFVRRIVRLVVVLSVLAAVLAPASFAGVRMWVGFHDDPSFRWVPDRSERVRGSAELNASIDRLLVQWNLVAKTRPSTATDPFDPAYEFADIDEAVRAAQQNDQEVILTISGTPRWANGGKSPNVMPKRVADFTSFARAIASRYSGRFVGYPFVRFWSVWNEPNLQLFLAPQFNSKGGSVAPANYAKLAAAAYSGIKAGNPRALVAIGETSARGSDKPNGLRPTHTPGRFAELVAKANPRLKFDAWSHHPYPFNPNSRPSQVVKWPNVSLASLPRLDDNLKTWFHRKSVPIWVTEYGHQTRPEDSLGVSYATQAAYIQQSISIAARFPFVQMFIWFVYQDDPGQPWESGLYTQGGVPKATSPSRFERAAKPVDARSPVYTVRGGTATPLVNLIVRRFCANSPVGTSIGMTWRASLGTKLIKVGQETSKLKRDCSIDARLQFTVAKKKTYRVTFDLNAISGVQLSRSLTIRGT